MTLLVSYTVFGNPRVRYTQVGKEDLCGNATITELLAGWNGYPHNSAEVKIIDIIPQ